MDAKEAGIFMRGFGDGTRLRILDALSIRPLTVGGLSDLLEVPLPKVSRHLRYLDARGLVEWATSGKGTQYRLAKPQHALHRAVLAAVL